MPPAPISIGIIGYRGFGAFCTEAFRDSGAGQVVAYAGRDAAAMAASADIYGVKNTYTDWRGLIRDPAVSLVHIVTPPNLHAEMAIAALQSGKHVLIEKPLATSDEDAKAILAAARDAGKVAGINYVMRYSPLYELTRRIAFEGRLGALTHVEFQNYASDEGLDDGHWFWDPAQSGGIFVEHGVHFFDIVGAIAGAPATLVTGQTWTRGDGTGKEDRVQALVTYQNGTEASFYHAFNRPGAIEKQSALFAFQKGFIEIEGWTPTTLHLSAIVSDEEMTALRRILPVTVVDDEDFAGAGMTVRGGGQSFRVQHRIHARELLGSPTPNYRKAVGDALIDIADAIENPAHVRRVTAEDGASSLRVALAARRSAETGAPVVLAP